MCSLSHGQVNFACEHGHEGWHLFHLVVLRYEGRRAFVVSNLTVYSRQYSDHVDAIQLLIVFLKLVA